MVLKLPVNFRSTVFFIEGIMDRRNFIKQSSLYSAGALFSFYTPSNSNNILIPVSITEGANKSRVVCASRNDLRDKRDSLLGDNIAKLCDKSIENLYETNSKTVWKSLFTKNDIVGLKVNCLAGKGLSTNIELVETIIERLLEAGVPKSQIIVWDRMDRDLESAGYKIYFGRNKSQCYGNDKAGFTSQIYEYGQAGSLLSRIWVDQCTKIINVPILKDHGIVGVSVALKNMFGAINNPNKYHNSVGDPYVADINSIPEIRNKIVLTICDAFTPQYEGGPPYMPQWTWNADSLLVAKDMVAMDQIGWQKIEEQRAQQGMESLKNVGREPTYIKTASDPIRKLGTNDVSKIKVIKV